MGRIYRSTDKELPVALRTAFDAQEKQYRAVVDGAVVKSYDPEAAMVIEGFANVAQPDRCDELMPQSCWDLANYNKNPVILREHDRKRIVGGKAKVEAKPEGLYVSAEVGNPKAYPCTADQEETRSLLAQGYLKTFSVGFIPMIIEYDEDKDLIRYVKVELLEISLVSVPMQQDSLVTSVKNWRSQKTMSDPKTDEKGNPSLNDIHDTVKETKSYLKDVHADVKTCMKALNDLGQANDNDGDEAKKLKAEIATLKTANEKLATEVADLKKAKEEVETKAAAVIKALRDKGILPAEAPAA